MDLPEDVENLERADMALFAVRNPRAILAAYDAIAKGRGGWPLCWPAVLAPQAWFLYRKMYLWAALVSAGPLLLAYVPSLTWLNWGAAIVGAGGLRLYVGAARKTIARIHASAADEVDARALIARAGGVSWIGAAIGLVFAFSQFVLAMKMGAPALLNLR